MDINFIAQISLAAVLSAVIVWLLALRVQSRLKEQLITLQAAQNNQQQNLEALLERSEARNAEFQAAQNLLATTTAQLAGEAEAKKSLQSQLANSDERLRLLQEKYEQQQLSSRALEATHAALLAEQKERDAGFAKQLGQLDEQKQSLKKEFENLANRIFEEKGKTFSQNSQHSLDAMLKPFKEQIDGFQKRINDIHTESVKGSSSLEVEIKKVLEVGLKMQTEATNLTSALKGDSQQRGAWGEAQLERTLQMSGLIADTHYTSQDSFTGANGERKRTDFIIRLPDNKCLIIDSKMTLPDYDRAVSATSDEEANIAMKAHVAAVRRHVDDLAKKDYTTINGLESPDFILMFMPLEPAYIEALKHDKELFGYGYSKNIVLVSHTTLIPILRTVTNLWILEQSNREAKELGDKALEIYNSVCTVTERVEALGKTLNTAGGHFNGIVTGLVGTQGLAGKVERFSQLSNNAKKAMKDVEPIQIGGDDARLQLTAKPLVLEDE